MARPTPLPGLLHEPPTVQEYVDLRLCSGLTPRTAQQAAPAVTGSWAWAVVRGEGGALLAMGRVIGDGG
ncbi:hypothetical protein [Brachybacterium endophyticum]|uniref:hypothetical protein n=1 Tax=Brachybacterium endophyticum TaxID=2182385 RepID=UPI0026A8CFEC